MKLLHTSDWHLGRNLYGRARYEEFDLFLNWLATLLVDERIDALLIAGDIFDTTTTSNRAQAQYYQFLQKVAASRCRHVVITGGNHDSPSFLDAPGHLLKALNIHVVGQATENPADEVLVLDSIDGKPELIVCAVPYLRDRDVRRALPGESITDKDKLLVQGLYHHYGQVTEHAQLLRSQLGNDIPIVGMGHLFAAGGKTSDGDGVRELYVGTLAQIGADLFSDRCDYVALGHLHSPQAVAGCSTIRYCGSPLPMGFGEARQQKSVCCVTFDACTPDITQIPVPVFQTLVRVQGDWPAINEQLGELAKHRSSAWLEIIYDGADVLTDLRERVQEAVTATDMDVLRICNRQLINATLAASHSEETLGSLGPDQVFERCLQAQHVPDDQQPALWASYRQTLASLQNDDPNAL
jgi:exonuclease SbcD